MQEQFCGKEIYIVFVLHPNSSFIFEDVDLDNMRYDNQRNIKTELICKNRISFNYSVEGKIDQQQYIVSQVCRVLYYATAQWLTHWGVELS